MKYLNFTLYFRITTGRFSFTLSFVSIPFIYLYTLTAFTHDRIQRTVKSKLIFQSKDSTHIPISSGNKTGIFLLDGDVKNEYGIVTCLREELSELEESFESEENSMTAVSLLLSNFVQQNLSTSSSSKSLFKMKFRDLNCFCFSVSFLKTMIFVEKFIFFTKFKNFEALSKSVKITFGQHRICSSE